MYYISSSKSETTDADVEYISNLSHQHVLPVARGLIALILYNSANVDMFLLACKVRKFKNMICICRVFVLFPFFFCDVKSTINFIFIIYYLFINEI